MNMKCEYCGSLFESHDKRRRYCSFECADNRRRETDKKYKRPQKKEIVYERKCNRCGKPFTTTAYQMKYCTTACRIAVQIEKQKKYSSELRRRKKAENESEKKDVNLHEFNGIAREKGMSYGEYGKMLMIQQMHEEMERSRLSRGKQKDVHNEDSR